MNNNWLITSELANQRARKVLFTCVVKKVNKTGKGFLFFLFNVYVQVVSVSLYFIVWGDTSSIFSSNPTSSSLVAFINMFFY